MQRVRRTNPQRTEATRAALLGAARRLFVEQGYAATSTPEIATAAQVTRGAMYHHFRDKQDLFRAVVAEEAAAVATEIEGAAGAHTPPDAELSAGGARIRPGAADSSGTSELSASGGGMRPRGAGSPGLAELVAGAVAYLDAMRAPGRTRLLLVDGPAVLGTAEMTALDEAHAARTLRDGLAAALDGTATASAPAPTPTEHSRFPAPTLDALAMLLSAAFDRAALAIENGADPEPVRAAMLELLERVVR